MDVKRIQSTILTPKYTGYAAAGTLGMAVCSGLTKKNGLKKLHKPFACLSAIFTILHVGVIEYYKYKFKVK